MLVFEENKPNYAAYALIMSMFVQTTVGIHLGLLILNLSSMVVILLIARRLISSTAGIATITYL